MVEDLQQIGRLFDNSDQVLGNSEKSEGRPNGQRIGIVLKFCDLEYDIYTCVSIYESFDSWIFPRIIFIYANEFN